LTAHSDVDGVLTVSRGLQVLRAFRCERAPVGNAELVRRTGLSKATVSRLTGTLVELGFLRRPPGSREFELGGGGLTVGQAFLSSSMLLSAAAECMQALADRLDVSVALGARNGTDMVYVAHQASMSVATLRLGIGSVIPIGTTSVGHAYLWAQPRQERERLLIAIRNVSGDRWQEISAAIQESFAELDRVGTCSVVGRFQRDAFGIALPVRIGLQRVVMGLSCGKAEVRLDVPAETKRIAPELKKTAATLEARLADFDSES
jgi:DNA-binding IclR family transcriptional regulator